MIRGVDVTVMRPYESGTDRFNNAVYGMTGESVGNVLVAPGGTQDLEAARPEGVHVDYTLHFPRGYEGDLEGCDVVLPAPWSATCHVVGRPQKYVDANTPTPWNLPVECEVAHG